jgi:hypothetical protein
MLRVGIRKNNSALAAETKTNKQTNKKKNKVDSRKQVHRMRCASMICATQYSIHSQIGASKATKYFNELQFTTLLLNTL